MSRDSKTLVEQFAELQKEPFYNASKLDGNLPQKTGKCSVTGGAERCGKGVAGNIRYGTTCDICRVRGKMM